MENVQGHENYYFMMTCIVKVIKRLNDILNKILPIKKPLLSKSLYFKCIKTEP